MSVAKRPRVAVEAGTPAKTAWPGPLPPGVLLVTEQPRRMLNITGLDEIEKRLVWECLKRRKPALADLLKDPVLHRLREECNGVIRIELD